MLLVLLLVALAACFVLIAFLCWFISITMLISDNNIMLVLYIFVLYTVVMWVYISVYWYTYILGIYISVYLYTYIGIYTPPMYCWYYTLVHISRTSILVHW